MVLLPKFRRHRDGEPLLRPTEEADDYHGKADKPSNKKKPPEEVHKEALKAVERRNGDVNNTLDVLGEYVMQFGSYRGKNFRWMLENYLGYAVYIVDSSTGEKTNKSPLGRNKAAFVEYAGNFEEVRTQVEKRRAKNENQEAAKPLSVGTSTATITNTAKSFSYIRPAAGNTRPYTRFLSSLSQKQFKPNIPPPRIKPKSTLTEEVTVTSTPSQVASVDDNQDLSAVVEPEENMEIATAQETSPPDQTIKQQDQASKTTAFDSAKSVNTQEHLKTGNAELDCSSVQLPPLLEADCPSSCNIPDNTTGMEKERPLESSGSTVHQEMQKNTTQFGTSPTVLATSSKSSAVPWPAVRKISYVLPSPKASTRNLRPLLPAPKRVMSKPETITQPDQPAKIPKQSCVLLSPQPATRVLLVPPVQPGLAQPIQFFVNQQQPTQPVSLCSLVPVSQPMSQSGSSGLEFSRKRTPENKPKEKKKTCRNCGACGEARKEPTHRQYFGNWYCQNTATVSFEEWISDIKMKKPYKRYKKNK